jgi:hypothetical protein
VPTSPQQDLQVDVELLGGGGLQAHVHRVQGAAQRAAHLRLDGGAQRRQPRVEGGAQLALPRVGGLLQTVPELPGLGLNLRRGGEAERKMKGGDWEDDAPSHGNGPSGLLLPLA